MSITYRRTWRKVRERNAGGACGRAWRELREREDAFALQAAQYQQGIRPAWLQAITLATAPSVKWRDPTPIVGYVDEGLHYADLMKRWTPARWWRAVGADGELWCESSDEAEVRRNMRPGDTLQRLWWTEPNEEWRDS